VDDFGGVEATEEMANISFHEMGKLLKELGFEESAEKAEGPVQEIIYLGITYNTKEGTMKVSDLMLQRLKAALKMTEGKEELTRMEMTELKWAIYFVNCNPENKCVLDEAINENLNGRIKISGSIKAEIEKWKEWDGVHKISYKD